MILSFLTFLFAIRRLFTSTLFHDRIVNMSALTPDETILGLLAGQIRYGYQLLDCFRDPAQLGEVWNLSTSQLYAVLKRLNNQGLIAGKEALSPDAPPRTEYVLTESGWKQLHDWLLETCPSPSIRRVRVEFLSRLYIARMLNMPTAEIVLRQKQTCLDERSKRLEQQNHTEPGVGYLAVDLVIAQLDAVLNWIDRCELVPSNHKDAP
jgi:DNA-binding PadR family transcriptional regulator